MPRRPEILDVEAMALELGGALVAEPSRLDLAALAIARLGEAPVDTADAVATLDGWGERVAAAAGGSMWAGLDALERLLVGELGFVGDEADYDHPRNSFLPEVLARRRGLPILLSLVWLEVARRAGLPLYGLGLPGHFVVAYRSGPTGVVVIDPFRSGRILSRDEVEAMVGRGGGSINATTFAPTPAPAIAARMLRNLVGAFGRRGQRDRVAAAAALLLSVEPGDRGAIEALAGVSAPEDN